MTILLVLNKAYAQDPRAQREITALAERGHRVEVLCFKDPRFPEPELDGVRFHSMPLCRRRAGRRSYVIEYTLYFLYCTFHSLDLLCRRRYSVMQVFLLPEAMILLAAIPRLAGVRVVADWMDLGYEVYQTKFGLHCYDPFPWMIHNFEMVVVRLSDLILVPNGAFIRALAGREVVPKRALTVMNSADERVFRADDEANDPRNQPAMVYTGTISHRNGADLVVSATKLASQRCRNVRLVIVGEPCELGAIMEAGRLEQGAALVSFTGRIEVSEVARIIARCDIGLVPSRDTPFTRVNVPTRLFEFGAMGKPVICADLPGIREYFDDDCILFHRPGDVMDLARGIEELCENPRKRLELANRLRDRCQLFSWKKMGKVYSEAIEQLGSAPST